MHEEEKRQLRRRDATGESLACEMRKYADDASIALKSPDGFAKIAATMVVACQKFGRAVSESETESMHLGVIAYAHSPCSGTSLDYATLRTR